jgi:hypothetical protein
MRPKRTDGHRSYWTTAGRHPEQEGSSVPAATSSTRRKFTRAEFPHIVVAASAWWEVRRWVLMFVSTRRRNLFPSVLLQPLGHLSVYLESVAYRLVAEPVNPNCDTPASTCACNRAVGTSLTGLVADVPTATEFLPRTTPKQRHSTPHRIKHRPRHRNHLDLHSTAGECSGCGGRRCRGRTCSSRPSAGGRPSRRTPRGPGRALRRRRGS